MNISYSTSQSLTARDLNELNRFEYHLESCISTGNLFFEDLENALENSRINRRLITQKLAIIRRILWENMTSGRLQLNWRPYKKS
ncbi:MAG: hypothetical protein AAGI69_02015 [Cyanobacteria bacterium P01_H01_bin.21]